MNVQLNEISCKQHPFNHFSGQERIYFQHLRCLQHVLSHSQTSPPHQRQPLPRLLWFYFLALLYTFITYVWISKQQSLVLTVFDLYVNATPCSFMFGFFCSVMILKFIHHMWSLFFSLYYIYICKTQCYMQAFGWAAVWGDYS